MALTLKDKEIIVKVATLEIELDEKMTASLVEAAESEGVEPEAYVLGLLTDHFSPTASEKLQTALKSSTEETGKSRAPRGSKPEFEGKLGEIKKAGELGKEIIQELKNQGLITGEKGDAQFDAVMNGTPIVGPAASLSEAARAYAAKRLKDAKAAGGSGSEIGDGQAASAGTPVVAA